MLKNGAEPSRKKPHTKKSHKKGEIKKYPLAMDGYVDYIDNLC